MFTPEFLETVLSVLQENCQDKRMSRLELAKLIWIKPETMLVLADYTYAEIVLALTILVPRHIKGHTVRGGRGGGIKAE